MGIRVCTRFLSGAFALLLSVQQLVAQALPTWTAEDRVRLKKGEIIAGASLLVDRPPVVELEKTKPAPAVLKIPEFEPELLYDPQFIPEEFYNVYFMERPESFLVDPQHLLSRQETIDREGYLAYHAKESKIDIKLYLFDAKQIIPEEYSIARLAYEHFADTDLTAIVFCFLGDPSRNQLAFGGKQAERINILALRRMLDNSLVKAMEKSDPAAQIDAFAIELSIKLYWMEEDIDIAKAQLITKREVGNDSLIDFELLYSPASSVKFVGIQPIFRHIIIGVISLAMVVLGLTAIVVIWRKNRQYQFPVLEIPRRLGADYAAGIGGVLSFHDKYGSPSSQRDQIPDYLTQI